MAGPAAGAVAGLIGDLGLIQRMGRRPGQGKPTSVRNHCAGSTATCPVQISRVHPRDVGTLDVRTTPQEKAVNPAILVGDGTGQ